MPKHLKTKSPNFARDSPQALGFGISEYSDLHEANRLLRKNIILELVYANCALETEYHLYKWYLFSARAVLHHYVMKTACF